MARISHGKALSLCRLDLSFFSHNLDSFVFLYYFGSFSIFIINIKSSFLILKFLRQSRQNGIAVQEDSE